MKQAALIVFGLLATPATSSTCPAAPDHDAALSTLISKVQNAKTEFEGQQISNQMWALWADAPDATAQKMLDTGMSQRASYDYTGALEQFDALVAYCPDYAEGYNQRAFVNFLTGDYETALTDLDLALDRSPRHIAAIAGKAMTLIALQRDAEAQTVLRRALRLNPWLGERRFLIEPEGQDL